MTMYRKLFDGTLEMLGADEEKEASERIAAGTALKRTANGKDILLSAEEEAEVRAEWAQGAKESRIAQINQQRDEDRFGPVVYKQHTFQADRETLQLLNFQVTSLLVAGDSTLEAGFAWWDINNEPVPMTADDLRALHKLVRDRNYQVMKTARTEKDAVMR